jgi:hypothetical protein
MFFFMIYYIINQLLSFGVAGFYQVSINVVVNMMVSDFAEHLKEDSLWRQYLLSPNFKFGFGGL